MELASSHEAHDLEEDQTLREFAISYKFNIGTEEYFSICRNLKNVKKKKMKYLQKRKF